MPEDNERGGNITAQDITNLLNSEVAKNLEERIGKILERKKDDDKREGIKDQIFEQAMAFLDLLIDSWSDLKVQKALENRFQDEVDGIDRQIREIRAKLKEIYTDASNADSEEDFNNVLGEVRELQRMITRLKDAISELDRKNQRALLDELRELREAQKKAQEEKEKEAESPEEESKPKAKKRASR